MNKLETINKTLTEIREILGAECANIEELPELVSALYEKTARGGFTTSFVFSSNSNPTLPVGGKLNIITGLIEGLNGDWSQTIQSDFKSDIWMSFAIFDAEGVRKTDWSRPINLKGAVGESGKDGEDGPQGPVGPPGEIGEVVSYRTVFAYTGTVTEESPSKPAGGSWDLATNNVIPPTSVNGRTMWVLNVNEVESGLYIWMSQATFNQDGSIVENWETPVRITGKDGKNGVDGSSIEFIYRLLPNNDSYTKLSRYLTENKLYSPETDDDVIPPINDNLGIDSMWTDSPIGISEEMQIEVVCTRTKKDGKWSDWSNCAMWSKWGEDGMDGDGVEYIYLVTPPKLTPGDVLLRMPDLDLAAAQPEYQQDEFCFNAEFGYPGYDWTDEPADVGPGKPLEWVSVRKKQGGVWQKFSEPKLWATYTERGVSYLTSFVFARAAADNPPAIPEGGEYYNPYPNDRETWHDSVPPSVENLPVWISTRTFATGEGELTFDTDWSAPRLLSDSSSFQVEYSADPNVTGEKITKFTGDEEAWRAAQPFKWGDDSEITDPIWMITASCTNGVWSDWVLTRIKGEKGDTGEAGSSVAIKHKVKTLQELLTEWDSYINGGPFFSLNADILEGEGVYVEESGLLYIYSGGYYPGEDTDFNKYWTSVTVKGEPGDSAYLYVAYTDGTDETATLYFDTPKKYIGVKYANYVLSETERKSWSTYTWQQWKGEDGWGQEQIFLLTHKDSGYDPNGNHLPLPSESKPEKDFLPTHSYDSNAYPSDKWSDSPLSPSEEYPYCWVATRKVGGEEYGNWLGYNNKCSLYSRHSYDGINALSVDLTNDLVVVPLEEGRIDPDFIQTATITTFVKVFTGDEEIPSENFSVDTNEYITVEGNKLTLKLEALKTAVKEIPITINVGNSKHSITWHILYTDVAYELIPSKNCLRRYTEGDRAGFLEDDEILVEIWKWSDNKWIAAQIPVFAYLTFTNGLSDRILSTSDSEISVENGIAKINLNDLKDVETFEVYIVQSDSSGQYMSDYQKLSFENIAIVADGQRGEKGDDGEAKFKSIVFKKSTQPSVDAPSGGSYEDPIPSGWSDGVPADGEGVIWMSSCTFVKGDTSTPKWSIPKIMADSAEFDVEYSSLENPSDPWGHPNTTEGWSNEPNDPIWMATSNCKNGVWEDWVVSRIKGEKGDKGDQGETGASTFKSTVFKRYTPTAENPTPAKPGDDEGSYDDPVPSGWSDGIPSGDPSIPIFSTYRNFGKLGGKQDASWSEPQLMVDTADFDVEYCTKETYSNPPSGHPNINTEWFSTPSADAIWMATSSMKNGSWTGWTISRVKGEKGDPGDSMSDEEKNAIKKAITEAVSKEAKDNIDAVQTSLEADIDTAKKNLNDAIAAEKAAREKDIAEAAANYAIKTDVKNALSALENKYFENGLIKEGVLNEEDVYNLSKAALGINANVGPNDIAKDSVFAQYVVGIAGRYVELKADQITSGTISGVTVQSESGSWQLNDDGTATLGNGGIEISSDGSVTFGPNVNMSWNQTGLMKLTIEPGNLKSEASSGEEYKENDEFIYVGSYGFGTSEDVRAFWVSKSQFDDFVNDYTGSDYSVVLTQDVNPKVGDLASWVWTYYVSSTKAFDGTHYGVTIKTVSINNSSDISEDDIRKVVQGTEISGDQITTGKLKASMITGVDELVSKAIEAADITTDQLNTRPNENENTGKITIKDNDIKVYDKDSENCSIVFTGSSVEEYSSSAGTTTPNEVTFNYDMENVDELNEGVSVDAPLFSTSSLIDGRAYQISNSTVQVSLSSPGFEVEESDYSEFELTVNCIVYYADRCYSPSEVQNILDGEEVDTFYTLIEKPIFLHECFVGESTGIITDNWVMGFTGRFKIPLDGISFVVKSGYNVYLTVLTSEINPNPTTFNGSWFNKDSITITINEVLNQSIIGSDGAKYMSTGGNYISIKNSGEFELVCTPYGFKVTSEGIFAQKQTGVWVNIVDKLFK